MRKRSRFGGLAALLVCLTAAGCPNGEKATATPDASQSITLSGTYHQSSTGMVLEFKGQKVRVSLMGDSRELTYSIEGDTVMIIDPREGNLILTRNADGTLTGPGGTFSRK